MEIVRDNVEELTELFGISTDYRKVDFSTVREVINNKINELNLHPSKEGVAAVDQAAGRLGPQSVQLSRTANLGPLLLSDADVEVEAHCHLGSILANVCVFKGKWQYEATIGTSGIQQIGWAPHSCPFTNEEGVGDSRDSYAFDGNRVAKWHDGSFPYGQAWVTGDVIGCCIDLDAGNITYYRNGHSMGIAFTNVRKGLGYFPAISLSYGEKCYFNFGRRPFEYPVEEYLPLQRPPQLSLAPNPPYNFTGESGNISFGPDAKRPIAYLTKLLTTLLRIEKSRQQFPNEVLCSQEDLMVTVSILLEYLAPSSMYEYYVVEIWYPFLASCVEDGLVETMAQWMQLLLERFEWESCMRSLFNYLAFKCRTTGLTQALQPRTTTKSFNSNESAKNFPPLALVVELFRIPTVLQFALSLEDINSHLEHFIALKQPSKADLAILLPFVWWQGGEAEPQCSESRFLHDMGMLNACIRGYEHLVYEIFLILHRESNPKHLIQESNVNFSSSTSTHFFRNWLNYIIGKNKGANRNVVPPGLSPTSVLVNLYFALLRLLFAGDIVPVPTALKDHFYALFCKATDPISEFARLGGALGHLQKTVPHDQPVEWKETTPLEVVMIDAAVLVYHLGVSSKFKASSQQQNTVRQSLARLGDAKKAQASDSTSSTTDLVASVVHELRLMNYSHAILVGDKQSLITTDATPIERRQLLKQETMYKTTVFLAELITILSHRGTTFAYTPEYYMEGMVDGFHSLRRTVPPLPLTSPSLSYSKGLTVILSAFIRFFNDPRIVNPDVRDLLLQSIGVLMQYNDYVTFIENLSPDGGKPEAGERREDMQAILVRGLLQAFDKKFWITVTSILLRIWKGIGIRQNTVTESPSDLFRKIFKDLALQDAQLLNSFLNNLFNTLNTTVSEFSTMKLEVAKMSPNDIRKANFLIELSINLLKILEVVSVDVPEAFIQSELNMTRLVELMLLILIRTTIGPEAARLDGVLVQEPHVSRAGILVPLVGIILNLDSHSPNGSLALMDALLADASFKMEAFTYLRDYSWPQVSNVVWAKNLEEFVSKLTDHEASKLTETPGTGIMRSASIELCSICYSAPIDTQFEPCKHASCHRCISRHLLNNTRCFFCNAEVVSTHLCPVNQSS